MRTEVEIKAKRDEVSRKLDKDEGSYRENEAVENALSWVLGESNEI